MHWGHEPLAVPRRKENADKSDVLQTIGQVRRAEPRASVLECAGRAQRRRRFLGRSPRGSAACESGVALRLPPHSKGFALAAKSADDVDDRRRISSAIHHVLQFAVQECADIRDGDLHEP
jgi:hypothetical protein